MVKSTHLGDMAAPDLGERDGDGLVTLAEYGVNTLPENPSAAPLPVSRFVYPDGARRFLRVKVTR